MKLYPHLNKDCKIENVISNVAVQTTSGFLSLDVIILNDQYYIYCHRRTKLYDDTIIYTTNNLELDNRKRFGFGSGTNFDKFIWNLIKNNYIVYGHNRDGMLLDSYIKKVKQERIYF